MTTEIKASRIPEFELLALMKLNITS